MIERVGAEALSEMLGYLQAHSQETVNLLDDLTHAAQGTRGDDPDTLTLVGYRHAGEIIAVQAFYRYGRWLPHWSDEAALPAMLQDAERYYARWLIGPRRLVDPLWSQLRAMGRRLDYDEIGNVRWVDLHRLQPRRMSATRRATPDDAAAVARLRLAFDVEYFGSDPRRISHAWCLQLAQRYIARGTYVAECQGRVVAMVATEAAIPQLAQIGAVFTEPVFRGQGFAQAVVTAICEDKLHGHERVSLVVRTDNRAALRVYDALGFQLWYPYRMLRIA